MEVQTIYRVFNFCLSDSTRHGEHYIRWIYRSIILKLHRQPRLLMCFICNSFRFVPPFVSIRFSHFSQTVSPYYHFCISPRSPLPLHRDPHFFCVMAEEAERLQLCCNTFVICTCTRFHIISNTYSGIS